MFGLLPFAGMGFLPNFGNIHEVIPEEHHRPDHDCSKVKNGKRNQPAEFGHHTQNKKFKTNESYLDQTVRTPERQSQLRKREKKSSDKLMKKTIKKNNLKDIGEWSNQSDEEE